MSEQSSTTSDQELPEKERVRIILGGFIRFGALALSGAIEDTQNTLTKLREIENPDFDTQDKIEELEDKVLWDTRIYKDRQQSLTYVCETPVLLERRAFWLARTIASHLD